MAKFNQVFFREYYRKHEHLISALLFVGGFLFDILTLNRIDNLLGMAQQFLYLFVIQTVVRMETLEAYGQLTLPPWLQKLWLYREALLQFLFGSLFSLYTLFYFKSASLATSFVFMLVLLALLILNEWPRFRRSGLIVRWALTSLCWTSFLVYLVPIALGYIGFIPFVIALLMCAGHMIFWTQRLKLSRRVYLKNVLAPSLAVPLVFFGLYLLKWIPPVPLSIQKMGIYREVTKVDNHYQLLSTKPFWRFWEAGDQTFEYTPGDRVFCYVRIFSPTALRERLTIQWSFKERDGWTAYDQIPLEVIGGREQGYRAFAVKNNMALGHWRVQVLTSDLREVGRLHLNVVEPSGEDRYPHIEMD